MKALETLSDGLDAVHRLLERSIVEARGWPETKRWMEVNGMLLALTHSECLLKGGSRER